MKEYEKWFKKADGDLTIIQNIISLPDSPYDLCCFHAQQAVEKYLKAYLVAYSIEFPKTHDLSKLLLLCQERNSVFSKIEQECSDLTEYAVAPRYPDSIDDITLADAQKAYDNAMAIKSFIIRHFFE